MLSWLCIAIIAHVPKEDEKKRYYLVGGSGVNADQPSGHTISNWLKRIRVLIMQLDNPVTDIHLISDKYANLLAKLGVFTVRDLLTHFPRYHKDTSAISTVDSIAGEGDFTIKVSVEDFKSVRIRGGRTLQSALLVDETGTIKATWFNQDYLKRALGGEHEFMFSGKAKLRGTKLEFYPTNFEPLIEGREQLHLGRVSPQYALTAGISIKWLRNRIKSIIDVLDELDLPDELAQVIEGVQPLDQSLRAIHFPDSDEEIEPAKERLSLTELTALQLKILKAKASKGKEKGIALKIDNKILDNFITKLDFELTHDQQEVLNDVLADITKTKPMHRLLEGDVGSGKTIVAIISALAAHTAGYQTVILAPTTVLADQHFVTFSETLAGIDITVELVTSATKTDSPADVLIGTSAVLARKADLIKKLGLVIVDEQHRFGVSQREELLEPLNPPLKKYPHFLNMTATPIPRSLALAVFGELEISNIKTKPAGRKPINTHIVPEQKRDSSYEWIREQVTEGRQVYWITPLIEESDKLEIKSATEVFKQLNQEVFPELNVALLHGRMKNNEKQDVMNAFSDKKIDILVSTSVIEVGINVPNATVMVIEGAERFGLAQLHQLRGRVGRSDLQSWCFLFPSENPTELAQARLEYFSEHDSGLEIAEFDLEQRGPGEVYGTRQTGIPDLKIANLSNLAKISESKELAMKLRESGIESIKIFA